MSNRTLMILTLADSGLDTAGAFLRNSAKEKEKKAAVELVALKKAELLKGAEKDRMLAKVLAAADAGIESYMNEESN